MLTQIGRDETIFSRQNTVAPQLTPRGLYPSAPLGETNTPVTLEYGLEYAGWRAGAIDNRGNKVWVDNKKQPMGGHSSSEWACARFIPSA